jgi:hypothetical protein
MRLKLTDFGLKTFNSVYIFVGFSKCGPALNNSKFYKDDNGNIMGYRESSFGNKIFTI